MALISERPSSLRNATMDNLQTEGFGTLCTPEQATGVNRPINPCYLRLDMREAAEDNLTVTELKIKKRQEMVAQNITIVGVVGDQFADIVGPLVPNHYKVPNPIFF